MYSIASIRKPECLPANELMPMDRVRIFAMGDSENEADLIYELPTGMIKRITDVSDPLVPPKIFTCDSVCCPCCNPRDGWLGFKKVELRFMAGVRGRSKEPYLHRTLSGMVPYESSFINFERGGSNLLLGLESAWLWSIDSKDAFQLGPFIGLWPVDGSIFIPVGLHPRYTFTPHPDPSTFSHNCSTWFAYGDIGIPFDFQTSAPVIGNDLNHQRIYYGLGIGYEWDWDCKADWAIDIGVRHMNLPLPDPECECADPLNSYRQSTYIYMRFGVSL